MSPVTKFKMPWLRERIQDMKQHASGQRVIAGVGTHPSYLLRGEISFLIEQLSQVLIHLFERIEEIEKIALIYPFEETNEGLKAKLEKEEDETAIKAFEAQQQNVQRALADARSIITSMVNKFHPYKD